MKKLLSYLILIVSFFPIFLIANSEFEEGLLRATYYQTQSRHSLRYTYFKSSIEGPKNTVLFMQGRGTFLEFYETMITPLLERGMDVWMYDLTGQGGSSRLLTDSQHDAETAKRMQHVTDFNVYVNDLQEFVDHVLLKHTEGKLYLGGYSTGAHVALRYLQENQSTPFSGGFFISPLLALPTSIPNALLSHGLGFGSYFSNMDRYFFGKGNVDRIFTMTYEENVYTNDKQGFEELQGLVIRNRELAMGGMSFGWIYGAATSIKRLWNNQAIQTINIPIFIATGGADTVVSVSYNAAFVGLLKEGTHAYYPEGKHELFRETPEIRTRLWNDLDKFISQKL